MHFGTLSTGSYRTQSVVLEEAGESMMEPLELFCGSGVYERGLDVSLQLAGCRLD